MRNESDERISPAALEGKDRPARPSRSLDDAASAARATDAARPISPAALSASSSDLEEDEEGSPAPAPPPPSRASGTAPAPAPIRKLSREEIAKFFARRP